MRDIHNKHNKQVNHIEKVEQSKEDWAGLQKSSGRSASAWTTGSAGVLNP